MTSFLRLRCRLEFDGTSFCGFQLQHDDVEGVGEHLESVQGILERALARVLHLKNGQRIVVQGCGRTDAGVHAREFYCHFDLEPTMGISTEADIERLRHSINCLVPDAMVITKLEIAPKGFHALKSVKAKTYEYRVLLRRAKPTIDLGHAWWISAFAEAPMFDLEKLKLGLKYLVGTHDFRAFMAARSDVAHSIRTIYSATCELEPLGADKHAGYLLRIRFRGDGFLKHQIRNMVGTLMDVAQGAMKLEQIPYLLGNLEQKSAQDRTKAGYCAPPEGLYLLAVEYKTDAAEIAGNQEGDESESGSDTQY